MPERHPEQQRERDGEVDERRDQNHVGPMGSQKELVIPLAGNDRLRQRERPVRAQKVAQFVAQVALQLPRSSPGTRVAPPELVWEAGQVKDVAALARDWLS